VKGDNQRDEKTTGPRDEDYPPADTKHNKVSHRKSRVAWSRLIKLVYVSRPCPDCHSDHDDLAEFLNYLGQPIHPDDVVFRADGSNHRGLDCLPTAASLCPKLG
jgi:hypothetical protein